MGHAARKRHSLSRESPAPLLGHRSELSPLRHQGVERPFGSRAQRARVAGGAFPDRPQIPLARSWILGRCCKCDLLRPIFVHAHLDSRSHGRPLAGAGSLFFSSWLARAAALAARLLGTCGNRRPECAYQEPYRPCLSLRHHLCFSIPCGRSAPFVEDAACLQYCDLPRHSRTLAHSCGAPQSARRAIQRISVVLLRPRATSPLSRKALSDGLWQGSAPSLLGTPVGLAASMVRVSAASAAPSALSAAGNRRSP